MTSTHLLITKHPSRRSSRWIRLALCLFAVLIIGTSFLVGRMLAEIDASLPPTPDVAAVAVSTVVLDRNGKLLRPFTTSDGYWRLPVKLSDVDKRFISMLVAYEDRNFYSHKGTHWPSMMRAGFQFVGAGGRIVSGGSTITMQVARLLESAQTRSLHGKLAQIMHARKLERELSKSEILTLYLLLAPYGGNIEGVRAASIAYFGKEPTRLSPAEAALLVALPQSPEARRPDRDQKSAFDARNKVLLRVQKAGALSIEVATAATKIKVPNARREFPLLAPHMTRAALKAHPSLETISLTIDHRLQTALEKLGSGHAAEISAQASVAIVAAEHKTGEILASVGSAGLFSEERDGFVDMTKAVRSPGSTLKPLIYGLAFELGLAHPESLIDDRATGFNGYVPVNFDGFSRGTVSIRDALTKSLNVPAIIALDAVGVSRLMSRLRRANLRPTLPDDRPPGLAIGLGGVGVSLRGLVSLYAAMAQGGSPIALRDGIRPNITPTSAPVLDDVSAWHVADILRDVPPPLNGSADRIAYKTGTSYGYRDAWAIGFDGKYVVGVWVGRPDGVPVPGLSGITAAAPILFESFDKLGPTSVPFAHPPSGTLIANNAQLPTPLKRFRHPNDRLVAHKPAPEISFPRDGVALEIATKNGVLSELVVKVRNGVPPFAYFANGAPFALADFSRQKGWQPDGSGYVTLSVVDAKGRSDAATVFVE